MCGNQTQQPPELCESESGVLSVIFRGILGPEYRYKGWPNRKSNVGATQSSAPLRSMLVPVNYIDNVQPQVLCCGDGVN